MRPSDGGQHIASGVRLSIEDVCGEKITGSTTTELINIVYAEPLDANEAISLGKDTQRVVNDNYGDMKATYDNFSAAMIDTGSRAFSTGEEAVKALGDIEEVKTHTSKLQTAIEDYLAEDIAGKINDYNTKLAQLKKDAKMRLLMLRADHINDAAKNGTSKYTWGPVQNFDTTYYPHDHEIDEKTWRHIITFEIYIADKGGGNNIYQGACYKGTYQDYKYIKYWGWIKKGPWDGWPWNILDDDLNKLINRYNELGIPLPYQEDKAVDYDGPSESDYYSYDPGSGSSFDSRDVPGR